jgi:hypothetical protein
MVAEIYAGISSFKVMLDIAKGLKDLSDASARYAAVIELQEKIFAAQEAQTSLIQKVNDLEKEVVQFKNWDAEKDRYKLTDYGSGTFAFALKPEKANGEPLHRVCANCFNQGRKSLLQFKHMTHDKRECLICQNCGKETFLGTAQKSEHNPRPSGPWVA